MTMQHNAKKERDLKNYVFVFFQSKQNYQKMLKETAKYMIHGPPGHEGGFCF
jgi:hypothetical protein